MSARIGITKLQQKLNKIEAELEKVRGCSPLTHGWQTQKYARDSKKWDYLAQEKNKIIEQIKSQCDGFCKCCDGSINCKYP